MKKKIRLNRQIIKAMTFGLSATIMSSPVTAFADQLSNTDMNQIGKDIDTIVDNNQEAINELVQAEAEQTKQQVQGATETIKDVLDSVKEINADNAVKSIEDNLVTAIELFDIETEDISAPAGGSEETPASTEEASQETSGSTEEASQPTSGETTEAEGETTENAGETTEATGETAEATGDTAAEGEKVIVTIEQAVADIVDTLGLDDEESPTDAVNGALNEIVGDLNYMEECDTYVTSGNRCLTVLDNKAQGYAKAYNDIVEEHSEELSSTLEAAQAAVTSAGTTAGKAIETLDAAVENAAVQGDVDEAKADLEDSTEEALSAANTAIAAATKAVTDTQEAVSGAEVNYKETKRQYDSLYDQLYGPDGNGGLVKQYAESKANADNQAKEAAEALGVLGDDAQTIAVEADKKAAEAEKLEAIKEKEGKQKADWKYYSELFTQVMTDYYIPTVLGGSDVERTEYHKATEGANASYYGNYVYTDGQVDGKDSYNYYEFAYKDANGDEQTVKYNYKLENNDADREGLASGGMVIFEKTEETVYEYKGNMYSLSESEKATIDSGEVLEKSLKNGYENVLVKNAAGDILGFSRDHAVASDKSVENSYNSLNKKAGTTNKNGVVTVTTVESTSTYNLTEDNSLVKTISAKLVSKVYNGSASEENLIEEKTGDTQTFTMALEQRGTTKTVYSNANYLLGNIALIESGNESYSHKLLDKDGNSTTKVSADVLALSQGFRAAVDNASEMKGKYEELADASRKSQAALEAAEESVNELKESISNLNLNIQSNKVKFNYLTDQLDKAEANLNEIKEAKKAIDKKLSEAAKAADEKKKTLPEETNDGEDVQSGSENSTTVDGDGQGGLETEPDPESDTNPETDADPVTDGEDTVDAGGEGPAADNSEEAAEDIADAGSTDTVSDGEVSEPAQDAAEGGSAPSQNSADNVYTPVVEEISDAEVPGAPAPAAVENAPQADTAVPQADTVAQADIAAPQADTVAPQTGTAPQTGATVQASNAQADMPLVDAVASTINVDNNAGDSADQTAGAGDAAQNTVEIGEEGPALADSIAAADVTDDGDNGNTATQQIDEPAVALAAAGSDLPAPTGWWALIVMILGTTGTEMYRRHLAKKQRRTEN